MPYSFVEVLNTAIFSNQCRCTFSKHTIDHNVISVRRFLVYTRSKYDYDPVRIKCLADFHYRWCYFGYLLVRNSAIVHQTESFLSRVEKPDENVHEKPKEKLDCSGFCTLLLIFSH